MSAFARSCAVVAVIASPVAAHGNWFHHSSRPSYYLSPGPAPAYWAPAAMPAMIYEPPLASAPPSCTATAPPAGNFAIPTPAPPSTTPALPSPVMPGVTESRSSWLPNDATTIAAKMPAADQVTVGFWNLSACDIVLKVAGQARTISSGDNVRLRLARRFVWQVDEREPLDEQVPPDRPGVDVVIRN